MQVHTFRRLSRALSTRLAQFDPKRFTPTRWLYALVGFSLLLQLSGSAQAGQAPEAQGNHPASFPAEVETTASRPDPIQHDRAPGAAVAAGFIENAGQFDRQVQFQMATQDGYLIVTEDALWVVSHQTVPVEAVGLQSEGPAPESTPSPDGEQAMEAARQEPRRLVHLKFQFPESEAPFALEPFDPVESNIAFIKGDDPTRWVSDAAVWRGVRLHNLAPGYVLELRGAEGAWTWDLVEAPQQALQGLDGETTPAPARAPELPLSLSGADSLSIDNGTIRAELEGKRLEVELPSVVSEDRSSARLPEASLEGDQLTIDLAPPEPDESGTSSRQPPRLAVSALQTANSAGQLFSLAPHRSSARAGEALPLYSLLLGGGVSERAYAIAQHPGTGEVFVTGRSRSFPLITQDGVVVEEQEDVYVLRLTAQGQVITITYLGGDQDDIAYDISILDNGELILVGRTESDNFPTTADGFQRSRGGLVDSFVIRLAASTVGLEYGSYFGGSGFDYVYGLVSDPEQPARVYFTGITTSDEASFPLRNPIDGNHDGGQDAYLVQLDMSKSGAAALEFSTYLGGTDADQAHDLALGQDGVLYLTGQTLSDDLFDQLDPQRSFDPSYNGGWDSFLIGLDPARREVAYGSYLGGDANECEQAGDFRECRVVIGPTGLVYLAGMTGSDAYPTTSGVYQSDIVGGEDIYITVIDPARDGAAGLVRSSLIGGAGDDLAFGLAVSASGEPVVVGRTTSEDLELTEETAIRTTFAGGHEAFAHALSADFGQLLYGTYVGGDAPDGAAAVLIDSPGNLHVGGFTFSSDFEVTHGDESIDGISDAFIVGLDLPLTQRMPVILIPGLTGSQIIVDPESDGIDWSAPDGHGGEFDNFYEPGEIVWVNGSQLLAQIVNPFASDDYFDVLRLDIDGRSSAATELVANELLREVPLPLEQALEVDVYTGLLDALRETGYRSGFDLFEFPYDWRLDIRSHNDHLDDLITEALTAVNGTADSSSWTIERVVIIGHSMGASVGRAYVSEPTRAERVDRLIAIGPAYLGTPKFLKVFLFGDPLICLFSVEPRLRSLCPLSEEEVKDIVQNMTGALQVGPGPDYWEFYDNSDPSILVPLRETRDLDGDGITLGPMEDYDELKDLLFRLDQDPHLDWDGSGRDINQTVWGLGEEFHRDLDLSWEDGIPVPNVDLIVGRGLCTLGQIETTWKLRSPIGRFSIFEPSYRPHFVNGDGTVPLFSAALHDPDRGLDFRGGANTFYIDREFSEHAFLPVQEPVQDLIINLLNGNAEVPVGVTDDAASVSRDCRGTVIFDFSPVEVQVVDALGRVTGQVEDPDFGEIIEQSIPGSSYDEVGETKALYVPEDGVYTHIFQATEAGSLNLVIQDNSDIGPRRSISFLRVPLTESTIGEVVLDSRTEEVPVMRLDHDGDGVFEEELLPTAALEGELSKDAEPPLVDIESPEDGSQVEGRVHLSWSAVDEGAGLLQEIAELDPETPEAQLAENGSHVYLLPEEHSLRVIAEDRLGNVVVETSRFTVAGPCELPSLIEFLDQVWEDDLIFHPGTYWELKSRLEVAQRLLDRGRNEQAIRMLEQFLDRLEFALEKERIDQVAAALMRDGGTCIVAELPGHD